MNHGMTLMEVLVAAAIGISALSIVVLNLAHSTNLSSRLVTQQQVMEALFHTVDTIKSDLSRCGMRLQEAAAKYPIDAFQVEDDGFSVQFGVSSCTLIHAAVNGDSQIRYSGDDFAARRKGILLYSLSRGVYEFNEITGVSDEWLALKTPLIHDYPENTTVIILKRVRLRYYPRTGQLKRRVDRGYFQPLIDNVTDFVSTYFPESRSVLYRLEVNHREQVRGYIFLNNLVEP